MPWRLWNCQRRLQNSRYAVLCNILAFLCGVALSSCAWKGGVVIEAGVEALTKLVISMPKPVGRENAIYLQMGGFTDLNKAGQSLQRILKIGVLAFIVQEAGLYQLKSGSCSNADQIFHGKQELDQILDIEVRLVFE